MKILINCPSKFNISTQLNDKLGGIESLCINLAKNLSKKKIKIHIATHNNKIFFQDKILNFPISKIINNKKKFNYDVVISANDAKIFKYFPNAKKIFWLHNTLQIEKAFRRNQLLSIIKFRPIVVYVSNYLKNITSNLYLFKKKIVIPNFLLPKFKLKKINYIRKPIFVWSVQRTKGLNEVIKIWCKKINPKFKNAKLYIFGVDKLNKKKYLNYLLSKNIFYEGRVGKKKLKNIYSKSMGMICLGYDETFCLNALEANVCGVPVITFGKTALKELIYNNYNGYIVKDYSSLADKIIYTMKLNKKKRNKIINNCINFSKKYDIKKISSRWRKIIK